MHSPPQGGVDAPLTPLTCQGKIKFLSCSRLKVFSDYAEKFAGAHGFGDIV
jgi:hypothetical protein